MVSATSNAGHRCSPRAGLRRRAPRPSQLQRDTRCHGGETSSIENLSTSFCDDFVCNSSPAVEQSVRQLASQLALQSKRQFAQKVRYSDKGLRKFEGNDKYDRMTFFRDHFEKCRVDVKKMSMVELDTARIEWTLSGDSSLGTVDLSCRSTFMMNVITGKVEDHREEWELESLGPASLAFAASRLKWSLQENGIDLVEKSRDFIDQILSRDDMESDQYFVDPMDPKKYIQQQDTTFDDALQLGIVLTLIYACVQVLRTLEGNI